MPIMHRTPLAKRAKLRATVQHSDQSPIFPTPRAGRTPKEEPPVVHSPRRSDIHVRPATFGTLRLPSMLSEALATAAPLAARHASKACIFHYRRTHVFLAVVSLGPKRTHICPVVALIATKTSMSFPSVRSRAGSVRNDDVVDIVFPG